MKGLLFDIKEWAIFDGPGIRTTVFFKGCPLRCSWCHNPEGLSSNIQLLVSTASCIHCGACCDICSVNADPSQCSACGKCIPVCPMRLRVISGKWYDSKVLAELLLKNRNILDFTGGGVTFSGGEPLMQGPFILELIDYLDGMHCAIETSGYAPPKIFEAVISKIDYVMMDLKIMNNDLHKKFCGVENGTIHDNLELLKQSRKPFVIRIPVIPGVNDTNENFDQAARLLYGSKNLLYVELLPYQQVAGAKYDMLNMPFNPGFNTEAKPSLDCSIFNSYGIECHVL